MKQISYLIILSSFVSCAHSVEQEAMNNSDSIIKQLPVFTALAHETPDLLQLNGKVEVDDTRAVKVFALASGSIQSINAELGDYVKKGATLAVVRSTEVADNSGQIELAEVKLKSATQKLATVKALHQSELATQQDLAEAEEEQASAKAELSRLKSVGSVTGGSNSIYTIKAPASGYIVQKDISRGSALRADNNHEIYTIADLSQVWIMAQVHEGDMSRVKLNDEVIVRTLADTGRIYRGNVSRIYNVLDPSTRTMQVRISLPNADGSLKPEMFANIQVRTQKENHLVEIPQKALIMDKSRQYVIIRSSGGDAVREVDVYKSLDGKSYVSGVEAGENIVTSSQVFLYQKLSTKP